MKLAPEAALATLAIFEIVKFGWLASVTVTVPVQRNAAGQAGSPAVMEAVLEILVVLVFVTLNVAIGVAAAPGASPAAAEQTTFAAPLPASGSAAEGVHVHPAATAVILVSVIPVGMTSVIEVGEADVAVPSF